MPDSPAPSLPARWFDALLSRFGKRGCVLLAVLAAMLLSAVTFAIEGEKPWGRTVQKRVEKGQPFQPKEYAVIGLWWGAVINAGILAALFGTARWWMPGGKDESGENNGADPRDGVGVPDAGIPAGR